MKFFHSGMTGAPVLSGTAGAMLSVLDACLKDGFGLKSVTSLTVLDGVATLNFTGGSAAVPMATIFVAGVTDQTVLNGEHKVLTTSTTQVTFATTATNGTVTGTVTFKVASLGWLKPFSGTNLGAYKASAPEATGALLRVDDTDTVTCRVVGYESMTDIATGLGRFPLEAQVSGGMYWPKSSAASSAARDWAVFGDDQFFAIFVHPASLVAQPSYGGGMFGFGDLVSNKSGDAYCASIFGGSSTVPSYNGPWEEGDLGNSLQPSGSPAGYGFVARSSTGLGGSQPATKMSAYTSGQSGYTNVGRLSFPDPTNNGLLLAHVDVRVGSSARGRLPGVLHTPQYVVDAIPSMTTVDGTGAFAGKTFMALRTGTTGSTQAGPLFVDLTGPWR